MEALSFSFAVFKVVGLFKADEKEGAGNFL